MGARAVINDPLERRAYLSRLRFLLEGTEGVQAWSLEYRSGLTGRYGVDVDRDAPDEPCAMWCPPDCRANNPLGHLYERRFVYRIAETIASTATGATLAPGEPPFFVRESISWPFESVLVHGLEVPSAKQVELRLAGPVAVLPTTSNYYHWLIEDLPLALRTHEVDPSTPWVSYAAGITDRHRIVADAMGAALTPAPLVVRCGEQILPGRAADSFFPHPADVDRIHRLGEHLTRQADAPTRSEYPERIYISRRHSRRPLRDEFALEHHLAERGFTTLVLEQTPWIEQIRHFQAARVVIAPHGAGLANTAFSPSGTTVVELTIGTMFNRCYEWLAHVAGHDYRPVEADSEPLTGPQLADRALAALS